MAKQSFLSRFPHSGLIMVIAVVLAIPLTVWSLNNVSTQTQQHAFLPPGDGGGVTIPAPTSLSGYLSSCVKTSFGTTKATLHLSWSKVSTASSYKIKIYNTVQTIDVSSNTNSYVTSAYSYATGYTLYAYVQGYNSSSKTTGLKSSTITIKCQ